MSKILSLQHVNMKIINRIILFIVSLWDLVCNLYLEHISTWTSNISSAQNPLMVSVTAVDSTDAEGFPFSVKFLLGNIDTDDIESFVFLFLPAY